VRFKSLALPRHLNSKTHGKAVQLEQTLRGSIFSERGEQHTARLYNLNKPREEAEMSNRKAAESKTTECDMRNLYFLMKEIDTKSESSPS